MASPPEDPPGASSERRSLRDRKPINYAQLNDDNDPEDGNTSIMTEDGDDNFDPDQPDAELELADDSASEGVPDDFEEIASAASDDEDEGEVVGESDDEKPMKKKTKRAASRAQPVSVLYTPRLSTSVLPAPSLFDPALFSPALFAPVHSQEATVPVVQPTQALNAGSPTDDTSNAPDNTTPNSMIDLVQLYQTTEEDVEFALDNQKKKPYPDGYNYADGIDRATPPVGTIEAMFELLTTKLTKHEAFASFRENFANRKVKIGTFCSGTECPVLAVEMIEHWLERLEGFSLKHEHLFSAEIEPFKQAYINRNWPSVTIFRDIVEVAKALVKSKEALNPTIPTTTTPFATTAFGGPAKIPDGVDLLVAGFCCVDFSLLNKARKSIEDGGESGDTLTSIIEWAKYSRPKMVIFENVQGAPWLQQKVEDKQVAPMKATLKKYLGTHIEKNKDLFERQLAKFKELKIAAKLYNRSVEGRMKDVGYSTQHINVDTAKYLLPQTRNRGYMLCVRKDLFDSEEDLEQRLADWENLVMKFAKTPANVSAESVLWEARDDVREAPTLMEALETKAKPTAWVRCSIEHINYRKDLGLGSKRKLTFWNENGYRRLPGFWTPMKGMTDRIMDFHEIQHLRSINRGFDDRYFSRLIDISQNVYRSQDNTSTGLMPCVTPSGILWMTSMGRRITGRESLVMNGLPVTRMDLSYLTEGQMADLAGNAMSSTVVGVAMMGALILFHDILNSEQLSVPEVEILEFENEESVTSKSNNPSHVPHPISAKEALDLGRRSVKLCTCEQAQPSNTKVFKKCTHCETSVCVEHSTNPPHSLVSYTIQRRVFPGDFEKRLKHALPMRLSFAFAFEGPKFLQCYSKVNRLDIHAALESELGLKRITRMDVWEVTYESPHAKLLLRVSESSIQWFLYANPPMDTSSNDIRRIQLEMFPIASMQPEGNDITQGAWTWWLPEERRVSVRAISCGNLIPSFKADRGLAKADNTFSFDRLHLEIDKKAEVGLPHRVNGSYNLQPGCGRPFNSLHVKEKQKGSTEKPCFLFFDHPQQTGNHHNHSYVITENARALQYGQHREVIARFLPDFELPTIRCDVDEEGMCTYKYQTFERDERGKQCVVEEDLPGLPNFIDQVTQVVNDGSWVNIPWFSLKVGSAKEVWYGERAIAPDAYINSSCKTTLALFTCHATVPVEVSKPYAPGVWHFVGQENQNRFFKDIGHLIERGRVVHGHVEGHDNWQQVFPTGQHTNCDSCAPKHPNMLWTMPKKGKGNAQPKQEPFENPSETSDYEQKLKARPSPIIAQFRFDADNNMEFKLGINSLTLFHQAAGLLTSDGNCDSVGGFVSLHTNNDTVLREPLGEFLLRNNSEFAPIGQPAHLMGTEKALRPEQLRTVGWAVDQERNSQPFLEKEFVEAQLPAVSYRLSGMASREVVKPGGILASDIGYGKTAIMVALHFFRKDDDLNWVRTQGVAGCIRLKATLVIVPSPLVTQWADEVEKFSGDSAPNVLQIRTPSELHAKKLKDLKEADFIILSSTVFGSDAYLPHLARFAGMVEHDLTATSRAKRAWHKSAREAVSRNVNLVIDNQNDLKSVESIIQLQLEKCQKEALDAEKPVPSKHLTGAAYASARASAQLFDSETGSNDKKRKRGNEQPVAPCLKYERDGVPRYQRSLGMDKNFEFEDSAAGTLSELPLEMFSFARIVVDEFHYLDGDTLDTVKHLNRGSTWLLSGTPPLNGHADVKKMAEFFGLNLGADDFSSMPADIFKKRFGEMTRIEKFLMYQPTPSPQWQQARHAQAQKFVDQFLRKDTASYEQASCEEMIVLSRQSALERAIYLELEQKLAADLLEVPKVKWTTSDYDSRLKAVMTIPGLLDPAMVLLCAAALFRPLMDDDGIDFADNVNPWDVIRQKRNEDNISTTEHIQELLKDAVWLQSLPDNSDTPHFLKFISLVRGNVFQNAHVRICMEGLIKFAQNARHPDDWKQFYRKHDDSTAAPHLKLYPKGKTYSRGQHLLAAVHYLRAVTSALQTATSELTRRTRAETFIATLKDMLALTTKKVPDFNCDKCATPTPQTSLTILCRCGHKICRDCLGCTEDHCPLEFCLAPSIDFERVPASQFFHGRRHTSINRGAKIRDLQNILGGMNPDDKFLIFVQFQSMVTEIISLLGILGCSHAQLDEKANASTVLVEFQRPESQTRALILNISNSSAAGCNLTNANIVIFFSPLYTTGSAAQQKYTSSMAQAIGRVRRFGQKKPVKVYHLLTTHTMDIDLFEERKRQYVRENVGDETHGHLSPPEEGESTSPFASNISQSVLGRNGA